MFTKFFSRFKKANPAMPPEEMHTHASEKACECGGNEECGGECANTGGCACGKKDDGECCGNGCC
jgi:hypothetical protein